VKRSQKINLEFLKLRIESKKIILVYIASHLLKNFILLQSKNEATAQS